MRSFFSSAVTFLIALLALTALPARGDDPPPAGDKPPAAGEKAPEKEKAAPPAAVTHHKITLGGQALAYTATAATIDLKNDDGDAIGRMFYVAYTLEGVSDARTRPVTFCFNGGPGSSSLWLEMGSFGPMRVDVADGEPTPPPPYKVVENPESLLDVTDLVFIDAMGTGYSRVLPKGKGKDFYGTDEDIAAFRQFILRWVTQSQRWNSPKFLLGESYGTTRAAGLLLDLVGNGMAFNGAVMVSSYLNAWDDFNGPAFSNDRAYIGYLPTMAATAWYHDRVQPKPASLSAFVEEARQFSLGEYPRALAVGDRLGDAERKAVAAKLSRFTGLGEDYILQANLRLEPSRFQKELLRDRRRTVGRLDARFEGIDHDAAGETPEADAAALAYSAAFVTAWNSYAAAELKYAAGDELYKPSNYSEVGKDWNDKHSTDQSGRSAMPDVAEDLRQVMSAVPKLRIFSANGYYDFATPFFQTEYTMAHMGLEPGFEKNVTWAYYEAGHMMYIHPEARRQMKADLAKFYRDTLAR